MVFLCLEKMFESNTLQQAMRKIKKEGILWLSRPCGTYCFKESDVFLKDTPSYNAWQFYGERNHDSMLAYVVEIAHNEGDKIMGNLYELDFRQHCKHVSDKALTADYVKLVYEHGSMKQPVKQSISGEDDLQLGRLMHFEYQPDDFDAQRCVLREEKQNRDRLKQGSIEKHLASLRIDRIEIEARRNKNIRKIHSIVQVRSEGQMEKTG